jgi:hypothetical protein
MTERNKDLTGVLFKNDRKEQPNHPDRKGSALIGGVEYWVAGWLKDGKNGQYLSLAFTVKEAKPAERPAPARGSRNESDSAW